MSLNHVKAAMGLCGFALVFGVSACNGPSGQDPSQVLGQDQIAHDPNPVPPGGSGTPQPPTGQVIGDSCSSSDPNHICLALKYVAYDDGTGTPVISQADAITTVRGINQIWAQCNIGFQIENYMPVDPAKYGLPFDTANYADLDTIRSTFEDSSTLLVVTTGTWNRSGTLGQTGANAWTNMPGDGIYGVVLEAPVGTYAPIVAHELGHYLNLAHVSDTSNLMDPIIYANSQTLTQSQCDEARAAAPASWAAMYR